MSRLAGIVNLTGATLRGCDMDAASAQAMNHSGAASITTLHITGLDAGDTLPLHASCGYDGITIESRNATVDVAAGCTVRNMHMEGQRCTLVCEGTIDGLHGKNMHLIDLRGNGTVRNGDFKDACFALCSHGKIRFENCDFSGAVVGIPLHHIRNCTLSHSTNLAGTQLGGAVTLENMCYVSEGGERRYVRDISELTHLGVEGSRACVVTPAAEARECGWAITQAPPPDLHKASINLAALGVTTCSSHAVQHLPSRGDSLARV